MEYGTVYAWVRYRFGAKLKAPRPKSHKQDEEVVQGFKKLGTVLLSLETLLAQGSMCIRYLCQDETRLGLKTQTGNYLNLKYTVMFAKL